MAIFLGDVQYIQNGTVTPRVWHFIHWLLSRFDPPRHTCTPRRDGVWVPKKWCWGKERLGDTMGGCFTRFHQEVLDFWDEWQSDDAIGESIDTPHFGRTGNPEVRGKIGVWGGSESWLLPGGWGSSTDLYNPWCTMMRTVETITFYKLKTTCKFAVFLGHPQAKKWFVLRKNPMDTPQDCFSFESQIRR